RYERLRIAEAGHDQHHVDMGEAERTDRPPIPSKAAERTCGTMTHGGAQIMPQAFLVEEVAAAPGHDAALGQSVGEEAEERAGELAPRSHAAGQMIEDAMDDDEIEIPAFSRPRIRKAIAE